MILVRFRSILFPEKKPGPRMSVGFGPIKESDRRACSTIPGSALQKNSVEPAGCTGPIELLAHRPFLSITLGTFFGRSRSSKVPDARQGCCPTCCQLARSLMSFCEKFSRLPCLGWVPPSSETRTPDVHDCFGRLRQVLETSRRMTTACQNITP